MAPVATGLLAPVATGLLVFGKIGNENNKYYGQSKRYN